MAQAGSDHGGAGRQVERQEDRRGGDRRGKQQPFDGADRRENERRSGRDRRDN